LRNPAPPCSAQTQRIVERLPWPLSSPAAAAHSRTSSAERDDWSAMRSLSGFQTWHSGASSSQATASSDVTAPTPIQCTISISTHLLVSVRTGSLPRSEPP
jgi:hypothetical protein